MADAVNQQAVPPKQEKKKTSRLLKFFLTLIIIFIIIPLLLVGLIFALFYDSKQAHITYRDEYPTQEVFNDILTYSLNDTTIDEQMRVRITQDAINQVFYNAMKDSGADLKVLHNFYINIGKNNYTFVFEFDFDGWFKTRAMIETKLKVTDEMITFKISNVKIGRVDGFNKPAQWLFTKLTLPDFNKILHDNGVHINIDLPHLAITYSMDDLANDLSSIIGTGSSEYVALIKEMIINPELITIIPYKDKALEADINLFEMRPDEYFYNITDYVMPDGYLTSIMENGITKVKTYLEDNTITPESAESILNYYVQGYDHISAEQKAKVDPFLSVIEPATDTYQYTVPASESVNYIVSQQLGSHSPGDTYIEVNLDTDQVDKALSEADTIGESLLLKAKSEDGEYTCNYITVDRVTAVVDADEQAFYLTLSVNFNGYDIGVSAKTILTPCSEYGVAKFLIENLYLGPEPLSEEVKEQFIQVLANAVNSESFSSSTSIVTEDEDVYLVLNIASILESHGFLEEDGYTTTFTILEQTATTPGILKFVAEK